MYYKHTINASDGSMHSVLDPFSNPVPSEGNENNQANNLGRRTTTCAAGPRTGRIGSIVARFVLDVYRHESDGEPGAKYQSNEPTYCTDKKYMAVSFSDIHCRLEHHHAKRDPGNPAYEADDAEDAENDENYGG